MPPASVVDRMNTRWPLASVPWSVTVTPWSGISLSCATPSLLASAYTSPLTLLGGRSQPHGVVGGGGGLPHVGGGGGLLHGGGGGGGSHTGGGGGGGHTGGGGG